MMKTSRLLIAIILMVSFVSVGTGCKGVLNMQSKSVTEQIMEQTTNPVIIAKAVHADALGVYNHCLNLWKPYNSTAKKYNPDLYEKVKDMFGEASMMLDKWEVLADLGKLDEMDGNTFKELRRSIVIIIAEWEAENG